MSELRRRMTEDLQLRGLSERTQEAYLRAVRKLAEHFRTPPDRLSEEQVRQYLLYFKNDCGFAPGSMRVAVSGVVTIQPSAAGAGFFRFWRSSRGLRGSFRAVVDFAV
ncbi:phage integrase N-terminal SAM-like domain-containing protein [Lignipirellula cremea]|uniref:Core-binding (CB) domain-containing protein n=1 Tax=Lignipirellula cremea TaxID=2528010 RepID=A0A518DYX3_9BACT|nr:hypothetical protein Pla8534_48730 [Lignipirellula cremea]